MRFTKRVLTIAAGLAMLSSLASGYYHFVFFSGTSAPFNPINLHFDLTQLTNNIVYFFISDQGPNVLVQGDSFTAVISELQLAAKAWNSVPGSQIQLAYGGLENAATQQSSPGIDVVFSDDIPAGLLAQTKVTTYANVSSISSNPPAFLPILRSEIQLQANMTITVPQQASFYDSSFTTMVHEFGHSLGLQHTLTSATMSTYITRSTTKSMPIAPDDIAGLSLLYPAPGFLATTGSISGQVTLGGNGVNLASVVALSPTTGIAISNLTNPDGTYEIDGIPPGSYLVYVHPLPPAAQGEAGPDGIVLPQDPSQHSFSAYTGFVTQFYTNTRDWTQALQNGPVNVTAANVSTGVNFSVQTSAGPLIYGMELAGAVNNATEYNPMLPAGGSFYMDFIAPGTVVNGNQLAPGLNVSVIGNSAPAEVIPGYTKYFEQGYDIMGMWTFPVSATTPIPLSVTVNNDLYILPAAFFVVANGPPTISSLTPGNDQNGNLTLNVAGSNLSSATQIVFDGTVANFVSSNSDGSVTVSVPPAPSSYSSSIEAMNPDGQTSGQAIPTGMPSQYQYGSVLNAPTISISNPPVLPGTDVMIQVEGDNATFNNSAMPTLGFGSSDLVVKQAYVVSPTELLLNVSVNPAAQATPSDVTLTNGLQSITLPLQMQVLAANPNQIGLHAPVTNLATSLNGTPVGGTALINVTGLPSNLAANMPGWILSIGNQQATPVLVSQSGGSGVVNVVVPGGLLSGPAPVQLTSPTGATTPQIFMQIDAPPPVIGLIVNAAGTVSSTTEVHPGDTLILNVSNLGNGQISISNIQVTIDAVNGQGGINVPILALNGSDTAIQIQIPASTPNNAASPLTVGVGTRVSAPVLLNIHN